MKRKSRPGMNVSRPFESAAFAAVLLAAALCPAAAEAENIGIPGFGNFTLFSTLNIGGMTNDGELGATEETESQQTLRSVKSLVGFDWVWDIGRSHKILGHYEYGGQFSRIEDTVHDARPFRSWVGVENFLGTFTFGKQQLAFDRYYGDLIDRSQAFYATGYTTPHAGGLTLSSDLVKVSTSIGKFSADLDIRPDGPTRDATIESRVGVGMMYRELLNRISLGGAFDREEQRDGTSVDRYGGAVEYRSEQWALAAGAHLVSDQTPEDTKSYNLLASVQITPDNAAHLSLSTIDDNDVYDSFLGAGYFVDHRIGSQFSLYSEGAATRVDAARGANGIYAYRVLIGVRYDFGNVWY